MKHLSEERLSALLDQDLGSAERSAAEAHLAGCPECRGELDALRDLLRSAAALPDAIEPDRDLWPGIRSRLGEERVVRLAPRSAPVWRGRAFLAVAAGLLVVASSATTVLVMRSVQEETVVAGQVPPPVPDGARLVGQMEGSWAPTVEDLERLLEERSDELQPATAAVIEENLRIIDDAIARSREALLADPANAGLARTLSSAYRKKVELLERAVRLPQRI